MTGKVLVTGANGHLGYNLTKLLVEKGYSVRAGVRNKDNEVKSKLLKGLDNVELVNCDITKLEQMKEASKGVDGIFHVAATFAFSVKNPEENLIKPTVEGTLNALRAAKENKVAKVILTSSTIAMGNSATKENPLDENSWNVNTKIPYSISKLRSEQEAWEYAKENGINMISVNPGMILGPGFLRFTPSTKVIKDIVANNLPVTPPLGFNPIDVRDIAEAQILVYETDKAKGRYITATRPYSMAEFIEITSQHSDGVKIPKIKMSRGFFIFSARINSFFSKLFGKKPMVTIQQAKEYTEGDSWTDNSRLEELGWKARSIEDSIKDTVEWLNSNHM